MPPCPLTFGIITFMVLILLTDLRAVGFLKRNALIYSIPATPPWLLKRPHINYNIHCSSKDNTSPEIYRNKFFEFCDHYKDFSQLYTDGFKTGNQVAAAVVHGNVTKATRLPNIASIFRAELHAISLALSLIRRSKEKNFIIFFGLHLKPGSYKWI